MKTPLAWLQLSHERIRLVIALAGIAFADILMFMQFGFRDALYESAVTLHRKIEGDIFLLSPDSTSLIAMDQFSQRRLYQARGIQGVAEIHPIYLDFAIWKNPITAEPRGIMVIGINPESDILDLNGFQENKDKIKLEDTVLFDSASRPEFGPIPELFEKEGRVTTEAGGRQLTVGGLVELGASFGADGNLISSDLNFLRLFGNRDRGLIDVGVIQLKDTANPEVVLAQIRQKLPADVLVFSKEEFVDFEMSYWQDSTAIGFIFTLGAGMGFIVGMVIVYQILYTDVANHLPEYATLKAMGYRNWYLLTVVFQEALILALLGYIPGYGISVILYTMTKSATSLPVIMSVSKAVTVLILTIVMCVGSGAVAIRKLSEADPADIF